MQQTAPTMPEHSGDAAQADEGAEDDSHADAAASSGTPLHRRLAGGDGDAGPVVVPPELRLAILMCRCFIYICSMGRRMGRNITAKDFITVGRSRSPRTSPARQRSWAWRLCASSWSCSRWSRSCAG